jgi:hypothetical protein
MADEGLNTDIAGKFAGLPLGQLICTPIIEVAKGQAELCRVYLDYVFRLAYVYKEGKRTDEVNLIKFTLNRPVTDGAGNISQQAIEVNAPLISLVPVPAFTMQEATVQFTMEVKEQVVDKTSKDTTESAEFTAAYWGFHAKLSGSVTTKAEHTRSTDQSAKYEIFARAIQQPPAEGMAKLSTVFASVIEPIPTGSGT